MNLFSRLTQSTPQTTQEFLEQIEELTRTGRDAQAYELLCKAVAKADCEFDILEAHWNLAKKQKDVELGFQTASRLLRRYISKQDARRAFLCWHDCVEKLRKRFPLMAELKITEILIKANMLDEAGHVVGLALKHVNASDVPLHLQKLAQLAAKSAPNLLLESVPHLLSLPQLSPVEREAIQSYAARAMRNQHGTQIEASEYDEEELDEESESLFDTSNVRLESVVAWGLNTSTGIGERRLISYDEIRLIVVAGIRPEKEKPYLVLDLFLDDENVMNTERRVFRVDSTKLNPLHIIPSAKNQLDGFFAIAMDIQKNAPRAVMIPIGELTPQTLPVFPSIQEYEAAVNSKY